MRILIVTDAWDPQVNGVVNTIKATRQCLQARGYEVSIVSTQDMKTFGLPTNPEIRMAYRPYDKLSRRIDDAAPDFIHIATEGPLGLAARRYCLRRHLCFTTSFHARFPEYLRARSILPLSLTYRWLRWFHAPAHTVMVSTPGIQQTLVKRGFKNLALWSRGVDIECFKPTEIRDHAGIQRPVYLFVGRVAEEKNIEEFLRISLPGTKWVIGDGPMRSSYEQQFPEVRFFGAKPHHHLAAYYNCADVLVCPSRTDTFGLVMIEAMACGLPVAAFPVEGRCDVIVNGKSGVLNDDLEQACFQALSLQREEVRKHALAFSWDTATDQFLDNLVPASGVSISRQSETLHTNNSISNSSIA